MTAAAASAPESVDRPPLRITAMDLLGDNWEQHVHDCTFHEPFIYPLPFSVWLAEWVRGELADLRGKWAALEAEFRLGEGGK